MVSLMIKAAAVIVSMALAAILGPQVFRFKDSPNQVLDGAAADAVNDTTEAVSQGFNIPTPDTLVRWVLTQFGNMQKTAEQFVMNYLKSVFPNASPILGRLVFALIILAVAYWKAEVLAVSLRAIIIILIAVIGLAIALALMGLLG